MMKNLTFLLVTVLLCAAAAAAPQTIKPGESWKDTAGNIIQAHSAGITQAGDTYYWFGEDRTPDQDRQFRYVKCYASKDLAHWELRNTVLKLGDPENFGRGRVLERPKVIYNDATKKYVMYMHIDASQGGKGYKVARVGVAVCDKIDGNYEYQESFRPLEHESRDMGLFKDDDGKGYLLFEDRPFGFRIALLSPDYLKVEKQVALIPEKLEGPALVKVKGLYYLLGSELTGWAPNDNKYSTASSLAGPWSPFQLVAPKGKKTYDSQTTFILPVVGSKATTYIYMGDLWKPRSLWDSRYIWMPLEIGGGKMTLPEPHDWTIDAQTGEAKITNY